MRMNEHDPAASDRWPLVRAIEPRDVLVLHATVLASLHRRRSYPETWLARRFGQDVEAIRAHLTLLTSCQLLVDSFCRESAYLLVTRHLTAEDAERVLSVSPVDVAYAIRWLELNDGLVLTPWPSWLGSASRS